MVVIQSVQKQLQCYFHFPKWEFIQATHRSLKGEKAH